MEDSGWRLAHWEILRGLSRKFVQSQDASRRFFSASTSALEQRAQGYGV